MAVIKLDDILISPCSTHHLFHDNPLYSQRFKWVMKFHEPGLAAVADSEAAYHILVDGNPAYNSRFNKTFGYYENLSAVEDPSGWFHINPNGEEHYKARFAWCGNYQNHACVVKDKDHRYLHLNLMGQPIYDAKYHYAGDFKDGFAVVQNSDGLSTHINTQGKYIHKQWFEDLDIFHKGFARAKDRKGWFHIDTRGKAIYAERYLMIENFYNGYARVENEYGEILRIDENGIIIDHLRSPLSTPFQKLSADLVGYWKTQTIKAAIDLGIFELLPNHINAISTKIMVSIDNTKRLLHALVELNLVKKHDNEHYSMTERAIYLCKDHEYSLHDAVKHWASEHYQTWMHLAAAIQKNTSMYEKLFSQSLFDWLDNDSQQLHKYQQAMRSYAKHDYPKLIELVDFSQYQTIIDAAGGSGTLLENVLLQNPQLQGILLERSTVIKMLTIPDNLKNRLQHYSFDLFEPWGHKGDVILLSRVLHDWNDQQCITILKNAACSLHNKGMILIIEMILEDQSCNGSMLDLNMLVITGGRERTLQQYQYLANEAGLAYVTKVSYGNYNILSFTK